MAYDLLSTGDQIKRVYRHDGISATILDEFDLTVSGNQNVGGVTWDGENTIVGRQGGLIQRYVGFSGTLESELSPGYQVLGVHWDHDTGYLLALGDTGTVTRYEGFSLTVVDSVNVGADTYVGVTLDSDGNLIVTFWTGIGAGTIKRFVGFSNTLLDSFTLGHTNGPSGVAWDSDGADLISGRLSSPSEVLIHDGFSATTSFFASPDTQIRGLGFMVVTEREGWGMLI